jgi:biotin-[acetyl-CoA-carboxylase] ligase BirA-like protein
VVVLAVVNAVVLLVANGVLTLAFGIGACGGDGGTPYSAPGSDRDAYCDFLAGHGAVELLLVLAAPVLVLGFGLHAARRRDTRALLGTLLAGVAVTRALDRVGVRDARLKWPNDVELDHKKVAGVLAHATTDGEAGSLVLGIGVNVHQTLNDFPPDLAAATSVAIAARPLDRLTLLVAITRELDAVADASSRPSALAEWRRRATLLGREVEVSRDGEQPIRGVARDIAPDGALIVGGERVIAGEVRAVR